jgi:hypothetical protein
MMQKILLVALVAAIASFASAFRAFTTGATSAASSTRLHENFNTNWKNPPSELISDPRISSERQLRSSTEEHSVDTRIDTISFFTNVVKKIFNKDEPGYVLSVSITSAVASLCSSNPP